MGSTNGTSIHQEVFNEKAEESIPPLSSTSTPLLPPIITPKPATAIPNNASVLSAPPTLPIATQLKVSPGTYVNYSYASNQSLGSDLPATAQPGPQATSGEFHVSSERKKLILCFDGTGNKFKGNSGDTNILKIFRMLDRTGGNQFHYYQPGIGTYITNGTLSRVHVASRMKSWIDKAMDAAVGTSFDQHVIGGYKFLMRYYSPGDDIFMFGFSRGAYTARFLAEMLDHVGLVAQGNEEMVLFAWKTFSNWQARQENSKKEEMYNYMRAFRETFARPVRRVRFLGLFDTVNSVPRFEQAWLKRSRGFPYTARSTARVIRHAVGIDERRAKFRQDLVEKVNASNAARRRSFKHHKDKAKKKLRILSPNSRPAPASSRNHVYQNSNPSTNNSYRYNGSEVSHNNSALSVMSNGGESMMSFDIQLEHDRESDSDDEEAEQDIEEVWFPGAHGDIGGGWDLPDDEAPLSHGPLVWMVREAMAAGVVFDKDRMKEMNCWYDEFDDPTAYTVASPSTSSRHNSAVSIPAIEVNSPRSPSPQSSGSRRRRRPEPVRQDTPQAALSSRKFLLDSYAYGKIHDSLEFKQGLGTTAVLGWKMMEYLPFRRMDLQPDGTWKPISWPLPCGEVRDIPEHVRIHTSVVRRMEIDETYRPGNLIVGGGGRGVRIAPKEYGTGDWVVVKGKGSLVGELYMKRSAHEKEKEEKQAWKRKLEVEHEQ